MSLFPTKADIIAAAARVAPFIHHTPVLTSDSINKMVGTELYFKCENFQKVGAFKFRGAINAILQLKESGDIKAVATHSSGNHAQALALAAKINGIKAYIVMPKNAPKVKREAVIGYGAEVILCEPTLNAREEALQEVVNKTGAEFVHPFDDYSIICGQATASVELIEEVNDLDWIITPVGGGGLLSGTALSAKYFSNRAKVAAAEPENVNDAYLSFKENKIVTLNNPTSIADGLLTTIGSKTFAIMQEYVDKVLTVSEKDIVDAMQLIWERMKIIVEPSGAVPLAAVIKYKNDFRDKKVGIIISGGNVDLTKLPFI